MPDFRRSIIYSSDDSLAIDLDVAFRRFNHDECSSNPSSGARSIVALNEPSRGLLGTSTTTESRRSTPTDDASRSNQFSQFVHSSSSHSNALFDHDEQQVQINSSDNHRKFRFFFLSLIDLSSQWNAILYLYIKWWPYLSTDVLWFASKHAQEGPLWTNIERRLFQTWDALFKTVLRLSSKSSSQGNQQASNCLKISLSLHYGISLTLAQRSRPGNQVF